MTDVDGAVEAAYRAHWGRLLALLAAGLRRLDLAEDCLQEAFTIAAASWRTPAGVPDNPAGWLLTTARRRALDRLRSETAAQRRLPKLIVDDPAPTVEEDVEERLMREEDPVADERLRMVFACCHPALSPPARVALTLRFVSGLTVPEIARMFLVSESTMAARVTRAKKKIATAGIPFRVPSAEHLGERLDVVLTVIYLTFTEGYAATGGPHLLRPPLSAEAIRLCRLLVELTPAQPQVRALLALLLLQHARRDARTDAAGKLVMLPDQDRSRWHHDEIAEGLAVLDALGAAAPEPYLLQAWIAAAHAKAAVSGDTDWAAIARHYDDLETMTGSPVVRLNRAVAVAEA
ncbi:MAG TPA: sigma-70 family RNA polymerase sigma factor, partial [Euzebya sp.]|nr:sigma-70 family RNA polymerase sigma factor [Euzebya sp.]